MLARRARLGAGALLGVLLLVAAAAGLLGVYYAERADAERRGEDREAGRVFAMWFGAMHRASMVQDYRIRDAVTGKVTGVQAQLVAPAALVALGVVPPGLPGSAGRGVSFRLGIINDGFNVPMAFAVMEPEVWANTASLREGALEGGLAAIAEVGVPGSEMQQSLGRIDVLFNDPVLGVGRSVTGEGMFVTADRGVRYADRVLYRRAQPGQSRLNRMQTALNAKGCGLDPHMPEPCDVVNGGVVAARNILVTPNALTPDASMVGGEGEVRTRVEAGSMEVIGRCEDSAGIRVSCTDPAAGLPFCVDGLGAWVLCSDPAAVGRSGTLLGEAVGGSDLVVAKDLVVGSGLARDSVTSVDMSVDEQVDGNAVVATEMTAPSAAVSTSVGATGLSNIGTLGASTIGVDGSFGTASAALTNLYGPSAYIGSLTVGSCAGCYPP